MSNQPHEGTAEDAFKELFGELCDGSIALAAGVFDNAGNGVYLNRGMRLMLEGIDDGTSWGHAFVNPTFAALRELTHEGAVFSGVLTLGDGLRIHRSIAARVWRRDDRLLVAGEMDVLELDRLNQVLISANREINTLQRELFKQNRLLQGNVSELDRQKRLQRGFAEIHRAMLHQADEALLLGELCEVAVHYAELVLAWVGFPDGQGGIAPFAAAGRIEYLEGVKISLDDRVVEGQGPTPAAYRTGLSQVVNDFHASRSTAPWHERARQHGFAASAAFPLCTARGVIGVLNVYADRVDFFGPDEIRLLDRLATDLAFAIEASRQAKALQESEARLSASEERLKLAVDAAGIGVWDFAVASRRLLWDGRMSRLHGCAAEPKTTDPATWAELIHPQDRSTFERALARVTRGLGPLLCDLRVRRPDGDERQLRAHGRLFRGDEEASARVIGICYDVTDQIRADARIQALAFYDPLTRLANRRLLMERIGQAQARSHRSGEHGALILLDIDHFKRLNDTLGHDLGDALLIQVADRLTAALRETDTAARLGGDELVVLCEALDVKPESAAHEAAMIGEKIGALIREPYRLNPGDHAYSCTASIGITLFHGHETTGSELLKQADIAMYQAKRAGRETLRLFQPAMQQAIDETARREVALRRAVAHGDLQLVYQPQVNRDGLWVGCEALLRWSLLDGTVLSPAQFLPEAETTDLMPKIGDWVVRTACREIASLPKRARAARELVLGINISARQLADPRLIERILAIIQPMRFPPARLRFEISEASLFGDFERNAAILGRLDAAGIEIELDDFGSGYSSLVHLRQLPLAGVKIDQLLIAAVDTDADAAMIVRAAIGVADALSLPVIAEGVERETQRDLLLKMGCSRFQGFLFGRPMPLDTFRRAFETACT
ncbi:putative bifunctional diguanylate cyclase/phosphodiesterase [Thiocapsa roseopersicina]|uniref:Diguanylate cyclase (GGDEF) domain-containing protein n=1 Tax=Thiocapsa roseopersicina TaxID=1058 RepID=A0A1H2RX58_THIRO|nr:EAL domain-containing protein [Thiocapsa roseopersicina]SDW24061.1 diguanylate cyclase (GGDEF) domain-containing protein [Thiocapsa roseopersicina]